MSIPIPAPRYYFAPGHTWQSDDALIAWVEVTSLVLSQEGAGGQRGRSSELDAMRAGTFSCVLDNSDRRFDPTHTAGPYYATYLNLTGAAGSNASTPDTAALDIIGDIDIRARVALTDWTSGANQVLVSKWNQTGSQRGYMLRVSATGIPELRWSSDGTGGAALTMSSTAAVPVADGETVWIRGTLDVDDGGGNRVARFYTSTENTYDHTKVTWTQLGSTVTTAGATSIFSNTSLAVVGGLADSTSEATGRVTAAAILSGIGGTVVADPVFAIGWGAGGASLADGTGKTWTVHSPASLVGTGTYLKPGVPFKVEAEADGDTFPVFRGFIEGFPQRYELSNTMAVVDLSCIDGSARLEQQATSASMFADALVRITIPERWYPLTDRDGSETAADIGLDTATGSVFPGVNFGVDGLDGGGTAAEFSTAFDGGIGLPSTPPLEGSVIFLVQTEAAGGTIFFDNRESGYDITFGSSAVGGYLQIGSGTVYVFADATGAINDGDPHVVVASTDGSGLLYVDGVDVLDSLIVGGSFGDIVKFNTIGPDFVGTLQHLIFTEDILTAADAVALNDAFVRLAGDTTGERIVNLLDLAGWPSDLRDIATGISEVGPTTLGPSIGSLIKKVEAVEQGRFFFSRDGKATFLDRYYHLTETEGTTSQATFADDGTGNAYSALSFDYDLSKVFRTVRGSRTNGVTITRTTGDGEGVDSSLVGIDFLSDTEVVAAIEHRLGRYGEPVLRAQPMSVKLGALTAAQQAELLGLELGHRVTLERTPQAVGSPIQQETVVENIAHRITGDEWTVTFALSPIETKSYFVLDVSHLDGADVLAY